MSSVAREKFDSSGAYWFEGKPNFFKTFLGQSPEDDKVTKTQRRKFYDRLRSVKKNFVWKLTKDGMVRGVMNNRHYCPLTAIAKVDTGKSYATYKADEIEIPSLSAVERKPIMLAADNSYDNLYLWQVEEKRIRETMLRILNLNEV